MRIPALSDAKNLLAVWAQFAKRYETDYAALAPAVGQVTLTANAASTTLSNAALRPTKKISLMPTTANAAAELGNGTLYVATPTQGAVVLTHANNAQTDRVFDYIVLGL